MAIPCLKAQAKSKIPKMTISTNHRFSRPNPQKPGPFVAPFQRSLPRKTIVQRGRDAEVELSKLNRRFRAVPWRLERMHRLRRWSFLGFFIVVALIGLYFALILWGAWSPLVTLKHLASFPHYDAARAVGLAPSLRGKPG